MPGIDEVLERLVLEPDFRGALLHDPKAALAEYDLSADDIGVLSAELTSAAGTQTAVEQRTTKAGLFAVLASALGDGLAPVAEDAGSER